jgi:predicted DNA-binding transcriptional regulator YafY
MDRVVDIEELPQSFDEPTGLDPLTAIEEHLAEGWRHRIEVVVEAPADDVRCWLPRKLGLVEAVDEHTSRIRASTDELDWYAERLAAVRAPFRVVSPPQLRDEVAAVGRRLLASSAG